MQREVWPQEDAAEILTARPWGHGPEHKVVLGLVADVADSPDGPPAPELVGLVDVIRGWPRPEVAHIGLVLVSERHRRQGLGARLHEAVIDRARTWEGITTLRVTIVDRNETIALPFWHHLGYTPTGESQPFVAGSIAHVYERPFEEAHSWPPVGPRRQRESVDTEGAACARDLPSIVVHSPREAPSRRL
ncbi:GNAT family N-acetyltransferase [Brachybacterium sillae]|uniref:GNAT family N-acetyltransferase n=1 Tax=Brachybacterium sillae TaxID=2810536 RepID=UPI00217E3AAB|nr:GNAT family N-acetyltransferase [Brachybacterium sillae]